MLRHRTSRIALVAIALVATRADAAGCPYLDRYLAPFDLPVAKRPEAIAGPGPGDVLPRLVGPETCEIVAEKTIRNAHGTRYRQITVGISGTVFGFAPVESLALPPLGRGVPGEGRENTFTDHAFIWQTQGTMGPFFPGVGRYRYTEETPASVEILIPEDPADWNGMMWVLVHGAGRFPPLRFHPREAGVFNRYTETSESAGALIDDGFAVVWTRRDAAITDKASLAVANTVVLDDGRELGGPGKLGMGFNDNLAVIRDYTVISRNLVAQRLGRAPEMTFYRGHSAGGAMGRSFLVIAGMNADHEGEKLFDGFYLDDTAGGRGATAYYWKSEVVGELGSFRLLPSDEDYLTFDAEHRAFMAPVVEVIHGAYAGGNTATVPQLFERVPGTYVQYKRENARINIEKGLGAQWKSYEIAGVSHSDASAEAFDYPELAAQMVDIGGVAIALQRALVTWVLDGTPPPATRIDAADVRELDPDAGPAIQLPETACPRGIFRPYMNRPDGTAVGSSPALFIPYLTKPVPQINEFQERPPGFREEWLEPLDRNGYLVDMTGSNHRMTRPSIEQAWHVRYREGRTTGILRPRERLTRERYVACVRSVVDGLAADGLLTAEARSWYLAKAAGDEIGVD
ncbi:MAG: alpha/beta hydrolase domain-containing protein [Woeseiaceae bacterium]|nr:alpha/beta hydrolase domain-containing protein [Woeseiaceae bacterium]